MLGQAVFVFQLYDDAEADRTKGLRNIPFLKSQGEASPTSGSELSARWAAPLAADSPRSVAA